MRIVLDKRFKQKLKGRFGKYEFEVGVLEDRPYLAPKRGERGQKGQDVLSKYAGGPIRQKTRRPSGLMISDVSKENRERLGFNYLAAPFSQSSSDIIKFSKSFFDLAFGRSEKRRCENLLQAIVRNPILRGEYPHGELTAKIKGFDRGMIDTGQLFKAIEAVCIVRGR